MVPQMIREYKVRLAILVILILLFGVSLVEIVKQIPKSHPASFMDWLILGVHLFVIGKLTGALLQKYKGIINTTTLVLTIMTLYISLSTGLLHYQGEGGFRFDGQLPKRGETIDYNVELHDGLNFPLVVDLIIPINNKGLEQEKVSVKSRDGNMYVVGLRYKVSEELPVLPDKLIVIYRTFYVIPMVDVIWLNWPGFS